METAGSERVFSDEVALGVPHMLRILALFYTCIFLVAIMLVRESGPREVPEELPSDGYIQTDVNSADEERNDAMTSRSRSSHEMSSPYDSNTSTTVSERDDDSYSSIDKKSFTVG